MIIYKATNLINNKIYIGQTINSLEYRAQQHYRETKSIKKNNSYFHNAIAKYGFDNFKFEIIEEVDTIEELNSREQYWIAHFNSTNKDIGYNLDSGGKNCTKSESTKRLIGITTIEKMKDPTIKAKMVEGLRKGTEVWQKMCQEKKEKFICPVCGKELILCHWEVEKRKYCSTKCARAIDNYSKGLEAAKEVNMKRKQEQNEKLKVFILEWTLENKELVLECPYNKISTQLNPLLQLIIDNFNIKDWRTIAEAVGLRYRKELLTYLKNYINENICCTGLN